MEEIIDNIMQSPENTNPNVLRDQLQAQQGSSSSKIYNAIYDNVKKSWLIDPNLSVRDLIGASILYTVEGVEIGMTLVGVGGDGYEEGTFDVILYLPLESDFKTFAYDPETGVIYKPLS